MRCLPLSSSVRETIGQSLLQARVQVPYNQTCDGVSWPTVLLLHFSLSIPLCPVTGFSVCYPCGKQPTCNSDQTKEVQSSSIRLVETTHPLTHPPIHPPTHSLAHPTTHSLTHPLPHSLTHPPTYSHTHPTAHSPAHSLTYPPNQPTTHPPTHSLTHSLTHPFTLSLCISNRFTVILSPSFLHLSLPLTSLHSKRFNFRPRRLPSHHPSPPPPPPLAPPLTHSFTHMLNHPFMYPFVRCWR